MTIISITIIAIIITTTLLTMTIAFKSQHPITWSSLT